jgi:gas vesicle protein
MADDATWTMYVMSGVTAVGAGAMAFLYSRTNAHGDELINCKKSLEEVDETLKEQSKSISTVSEKSGQCELEAAKTLTTIAELRHHVSENYSTKGDTQNLRAEMIHSVERVHDVMEDIKKTIAVMPQTIIALMGKHNDKN